MENNRKARKIVFTGAIIGGIMSLAIALLMDSFYADTFQGTWRDAIAKDLNMLASLGVASDSFIVYLVFIVVLAILSAFGGFLGFIFSFFLIRFFAFLTDK